MVDSWSAHGRPIRESQITGNRKPDPNKLMASNDEKKIGEAIGLFKQFVSEMQKWYQDGLWRETAAEWIATIHR